MSTPRTPSIHLRLDFPSIGQLPFAPAGDGPVRSPGASTAMKQVIELWVNGDRYQVAAPPWRTLNDVLREDLRLTGTKRGCGDGDCGACTVLLDGRAVVSCLTLAVEAAGRAITTVEGIARGREQLHPIQEAFIEQGAIQCGFCTPGMELSALALLERHPDPTEDQIRAALAGNLCRCTGYTKIVAAIQEAARRQKSSA